MDNECALWSCTEAAGHSQAHDALAQEEGNVGVVIVGGMYDRLEIVVANKCLTSRAVGRACGVPLLPAASLETNPWHLSDTFFNRLLQDGEAARHWLFYAPTLNTAAFRSVWLYYESKLVPGYPGMNKTVYYLKVTQRSPSQGMFRLTKYPVPGIQPEALYVLLFKPKTAGKSGVFGGEGKSTEVSANKIIQPSKTGDDLTLDNRALTVEADAARATLSSLPDQIVGSTSLPSEDPVSEQVLRKLEYLDVKDELIKKEEVLTRIKDAKGGEEDKVLQEVMTIPSARARVLLQQDDLCKLIRALGVLTSASVDGMMQNLEMEIDDDVDIKIGKGWLLLDRDRVGMVTPDEVAEAAMYLKDTLSNGDLQRLIGSLSKDKGMVKVNDCEDENRNEFLRLVKKEVEGEDVDGEKAAMKAYKAACDQSDEAAEADKVSFALMEKVDDGMIQNLEKEIDDDVDIKIGKGCRLLDRDGDGKVTPDEVAAAAMCT